ncbi:MAG TPA: MFS transporter [Bacteroidota bacterium]|nr:MFS transporter [Bacteroidota bacterium]
MSVRESLQKIRHGFHSTFWVANITELFERLAYYGPQAVLAIYLHEHLNLSSEQTTWLIGYYGFVVWFMPVIGGTLADRFGFRRTLAGAFMILAIGNFLLGSLSAPWMGAVRDALPLFGLMHLLMLIPAMGPAVVKPVVVGTTAHAAKEEVRSIGYSIYYTIVNIGAALGPIVASIVRKSVGVEDVFLVSAGTTLTMAVVTLIFYREPVREPGRRVTRMSDAFVNLFRVLMNPRFVIFLLIFSGFWVMFWQQYLSLPIFIRDYVNPNADVDRLLAVEATTVITLQFVVTFLTRKIPAFSAMIAGVLISSLSFLILTFGASTGYIVAALVVLAVGEVTQAPRYYEYVSRLAPPDQQGLFMGYAFLPVGIGYLIGGRLAGSLLHHYGEVQHTPSAMWYIVSGVGLLTTVLMIVYNRIARPGGIRQ